VLISDIWKELGWSAIIYLDFQELQGQGQGHTGNDLFYQ
jgi:hypothetical protein